MSRINTNVDSIIALNNLSRSNKQLGISLTRLSTGLRVNSGKDDPAGLISGEFLRQEISAIRSAIQNNNRANNVLSTADAALAEITNLLDDIRGLLTTSANKGVLSQEELEANQQFIDSAISSINRISGTTQFAGRKLIDGNLGFQLSGLSPFDSGSSTFTDVDVQLANFNINKDPITVTVALTTLATQASVAVATTTPTVDSTIEVIGNRGSAVIQIGAGQSLVEAVNGLSDATGVFASGSSLISVDFGENAFATVRNIIGDVLATSETSANGTDSVGTVNGQLFSGDGLDASVRTTLLEIDFTFSAGAATGTTSFTIEGGGAQFQLGQEINIANQINVGLQSFSAANLGHVNFTEGDRTLASIVTGGPNSLLEDRAAVAESILTEALAQVGSSRSRIGALQRNTIETNINSLQVTLENISSARSEIIDTDFAEETANLTRLQILVQAGTSALSIANARPQGVLTLLGG